MGWNTDQPPLEYLQRRVVYYRKKIGTVKGFLTRDDTSFLWRKYGNRLPEIVERSVIRYEKRVRQFELAVKILVMSGKFKTCKTNGKKKKKGKQNSILRSGT